MGAANGILVYRFYARDLLVALARNPMEIDSILCDRGRNRARNDHGVDINAAGEGVIVGRCLY